MRSDRITPNQTWLLVHDTPNCITVQDDLRKSGIKGLIQVYENRSSPQQMIYLFHDSEHYHRIVYQLIDAEGNLSDDLTPPSDDLLDILRQMYYTNQYHNIKLEYHRSVWDYYKSVVSGIDMAEPVIIGDIVTQVKAPRKPNWISRMSVPQE